VEKLTTNKKEYIKYVLSCYVFLCFFWYLVSMFLPGLAVIAIIILSAWIIVGAKNKLLGICGSIYYILVLLLIFHSFNGISCSGGWVSHSIGRGTCSWHGGEPHYNISNILLFIVCGQAITMPTMFLWVKLWDHN
jgi:hypothetical protein